ncbi:glycosyl hydrolase [Apilactobacillus kunkeei DSM 12361 = ATCC 700308]|uniref:dextransucrase n=2 Tax=Lactobacillales TaxID=186826 RepID=A0A0R1FLE8_9LACO|nr:glycoside hydrolase family 70 protein [Apilactobacillus kunkeei]KOY72228.1 Membrane associated glycosyl hydrolase with glucan-binding domain [Apilactobacillus kunkeei DSM 12361 = ATCC 700308]KRK22576.1 glycosyl hydrolase [Apilactobacillus kunkeei DSM 12361 = ATCC 700308]QYU52892.1 KxYKxGKxW signal peptide domain-containing protein [Apilactobacillus kunkeei]
MNFSNNEKKLHYKMYKSGKQWITAGIITGAMAITFVSFNGNLSAHAASAVNSDSNEKVSKTSEEQNVKSDSSDKVTSAVSSNADSSQASSSSVLSSASIAGSLSAMSNAGSSTASSSVSSVNSQDVTVAGANDSSADQSVSPQLASNASNDFKSHTKYIDGKTYYYNDNVEVKSQVIVDNGSLYYFGPDGVLTNTNNNFASGTIAASDKTAIYSADDKNITNVNGFITADSWYRPKQIQVNDSQWRDSTSNDFRPLLSVWWPSQKVEIDYLNYMSKQGLVSGKFSSNNTSEQLNQAAATVRLNIEKNIQSNNGSVDKIKTIFTNFVNSQSQWNMTSENYDLNDGFQGGSLIYGNNSLTPNANSDYRIINRNPSQQNGVLNYNKTSYIGYEFLLANDVDNSNPTVQAETLNWLYYMMNFGTITQNDKDANFDGVRVDAVDNMNADILDIIAGYYKDAYGINKNDKNANDHLAILEDWSANDPQYLKDKGSNQITIDGGYKDALANVLTNDPKKRSDIAKLITAGVVNRRKDSTYNTAIPNYSIVRAHDAGVQTVIAQIIQDKINPTANGLNPTWDEINKAFKIYNADEKSTNKKYTQYNIPSAYALMLTNKDTTPRVYYGDLYTDNGQFMATKTPYYNSISAMLKGRVKYVAGGQAMKTVSVNKGKNKVLVSVRFGKGANTVTSKGTKQTRKSGIAVIESNNPKLKLGKKDKVVIYMGAAHKNQAYRPLVKTTKKGIATYATDKSAKKSVIYTDSKGRLVLTGSAIKGYANPQVSGYLSMWVPVGASAKQDVRTAASTKTTKDGKSYHSNAALDSNVIFEAFSNFQSMPTKQSEYSNVVIAKNAKLFSGLGFTNIELPPQYRSTNDGTFLDSTVQNGYSFNDRYDLGFNTPTKYGTAEQLTAAIKALHAQNLKVLMDFVPDQLYMLPKQQVVSATRVNQLGVLSDKTNLINMLYDSYSQGSGTDYQAKYGGEFLNQLQKMYPDLFTTKQVSTGKTIDPSTKIKVWDAKYLNGSNIQGRGAEYVLSNSYGAGYFTVLTSDNPGIQATVLPKELLGQTVNYGLTNIDGQQRYITPSGYVATNSFLKDESGNWYYVDAQGNFATSPTIINGYEYYFLPNGVNVRDAMVTNHDGTMTYYQANGIQAQSSGYYLSNNIGRIIYIDKNGYAHKGFLNTGNNIQYFDKNGYQIKGGFVTIKGIKRFFAAGSGNLVKNSFFSSGKNWYYANAKGHVIKGHQTINGKKYYFYSDGVQAKNKMVVNKNKTISYYNASSAQLVTKSFKYKGKTITVRKGVIYAPNKLIVTSAGKFLLNAKSQVRSGVHKISGKYYAFDGSGKMKTSGTTKVSSVTYKVRKNGTVNFNTGKIVSAKDLKAVKKQLASKKKAVASENKKVLAAKKAVNRNNSKSNKATYKKATKALKKLKTTISKLNGYITSYNKRK